MTKLTGILILVLIITACASNEEELESKKAELSNLKDEKNSLTQKIEHLEQEILLLDQSFREREKKPAEVKILKPVPFSHYIEVHGEAYTDYNIAITPEVSGIIRTVHFKEGDWIKKGVSIMQLDDEVLLRNKDEIETDLAMARDVFQRQKNLWERNIGSELEFIRARHEVNRLENALNKVNTQLDQSKVLAPFNGYLDKLMLQEGEMASTAQPVARLVNPENMKIRARVSEEYRTRLTGLDSARVVIPAISYTQRATISHIGHIINPGSRTFTVSVLLENKEHTIKPNMLATVGLRDYHRDSAIVIPVNVIRQENDIRFVYVAIEEDGKSIARRKEIKTGKTYRNKTEVLSGLESNDQILIKGYSSVNDGDALNIQNQ